MYNFQTQYKQGLHHEGEVIGHLSREWHCRKSELVDEYRGIDYFLTHKRNPRYTRSIEIKSDTKTHITGNTFIEIISQDTQNKEGWAYSCKADYLFYYVVERKTAFVTTPRDIQRHLRDWTLSYPSRTAKNESYCSHGLLVPISEFRRICSQVLKIKSTAAITALEVGF